MGNLTDWWMFWATIISGITVAVATFCAVVYTEKRTAKRFEKEKEPKLNFVFDREFDFEPEDSGVETNPSGCRLICQNVGQVPVFIENIVLQFKGDAICPICPADDQYSAIKPFESKCFPINNEEFDCICYHCKNQDSEECVVSVSMARGDSFEVRLDLFGVAGIYKSSPEALEYKNFEVTP